MNITFVIPSLSSGGAERCAVLLIEELKKRGYNITVATIHASNRDFYELPEGTKRYALALNARSNGIFQALKRNWDRVIALRKIFVQEKPDCIISFLPETSVTTLFACKGVNAKVIISEQNDPIKSLPSQMWQYLRKTCYPSANYIVSSSKGVNEFFKWIPDYKRSVIYNPLAEPDTKVTEDETKLVNTLVESSQKTLVAMGRLKEQKGFDLLLNAFDKIKTETKDWNLVIIGEGESREELEQIRDNLGLNERVFFPGRLKNPFALMKKSDLFVLSSRYEGFGNVIVEAMSCELPVVSFDCPSGPSEIISDGENGFLVPAEDIDELADKLKELMLNDEKRLKFAEKAPSVADNFSVSHITDKWEELIKDLASE